MYPSCLQEVYTFTNNMVTFGDQEITEFYKSGKQNKLVAFVTCDWLASACSRLYFT